jgi:hypothetical protein
MDVEAKRWMETENLGMIKSLVSLVAVSFTFNASDVTDATTLKKFNFRYDFSHLFLPYSCKGLA